MITLCGFALSNYYNKVKLALLEKGIPFEEEWVMTGSKDEAVLSCSPLGKVPYLRTPQGPVCESQVILDYLEDLQPQPALLPHDAYARAKVRELCTFLDLHVELVGRELYGQAFFGGTCPAETQERVRKQLTRNLGALKRLIKLSPWAAGDQLTLADCSAYATLPTVAAATKAVLGEDLLQAAGIDWKAYLKLWGDRPSGQRVAADRKTATEKFAAMQKKG
ncbi:MAG: glutathione S-transferase [Rubrivivax sp.]